jgi:hypothetical protein
MAKSKKGDRADGYADIAAAKALSPMLWTGLSTGFSESARRQEQ